MQRSYFIAAGCSLFIHILIILCLFNYIHTNQQKLVGYKNIVQAYVMPDPIIISKQHRTFARSSRSVIPARYPVIPAKAGIQKTDPRFRGDDKRVRGDDNKVHGDDSKVRKSGNPEQLLIILHNQIQQQINNSNYDLPETLNKKSVEVQFLLMPGGGVRDINIVQSSGVLFLDNLAIQAVKSIAPCNAARKYLNTKSYFKIKVYYNTH